MKTYIKILRSSDPLDMPAGEIDTRFPRIKDGTISTFILRDGARKDNTEKGSEAISYSLESTKPLTDTDGQELRVGFKFKTRINGASGKRSVSDWAKDLALFIKAVDGPKTPITPRSVWDNPAQFDGKLVEVKVGIQKEQNGFPESNSVKAWIVPA